MYRIKFRIAGAWIVMAKTFETADHVSQAIRQFVEELETHRTTGIPQDFPIGVENGPEPATEHFDPTDTL